MKTFIKFVTFSFIFVLAGCATKDVPSAPNELSAESQNLKLQIEEKVETPSDWQVYKNEEVGFQISYPQNWIYLEIEEGTKIEEENKTKKIVEVVFGTPESRQGGYIWGISFHNSQDLEAVIARTGNQFDDRKEKRKNIKFNNIEALHVTVTTDRWPNWISEKVYFTKNDTLFGIGNGAIPDDNFKPFYNSFKWIE